MRKRLGQLVLGAAPIVGVATVLAGVACIGMAALDDDPVATLTYGICAYTMLLGGSLVLVQAARLRR